MDESRVGPALRALRRARGLRQVDVAKRAGLSRATVSAIECGDWDTMTIDGLRRAFDAVGARFVCLVRYRGGDLDRLLDERHAATSIAVAALLRRRGWIVLGEVSFNSYGDRGSVDLLAWHAATRTLLVVEVKTDIASAEEMLRRLDVKARLGPELAKERFGARPARVVRLLAVTERTANRDRVARLEGLLRDAFPLRGAALRAWLRAPGSLPAGAAGGLLFVDPSRNAVPGGVTVGPKRVRRPREVPTTTSRAWPPSPVAAVRVGEAGSRP